MWVKSPIPVIDTISVNQNKTSLERQRQKIVRNLFKHLRTPHNQEWSPRVLFSILLGGGIESNSSGSFIFCDIKPGLCSFLELVYFRQGIICHHHFILNFALSILHSDMQSSNSNATVTAHIWWWSRFNCLKISFPFLDQNCLDSSCNSLKKIPEVTDLEVMSEG